MTDNDETLRSIGISPRERLERIEKVLERVDHKLDGKADASQVAALDVRMRIIETQMAERPMLVADFRKLQDDVEMLRSTGSPQAQEADREVKHLREVVEKLQRRQAYYAGSFGVLTVAVAIAARRWPF